MTKIHSNYYLGLTFVLTLLWGCAQQRTLTGGAADTEGPQITLAVPANYSTNFSSNTIFIEFDEYIELNDMNNQLIISPLMETKPDIRLKKTGIYVTFKEPLQSNTTYTLNFGEGIRDFTAGNAAPNLRYVFSTGDYIDSLKTKAKLINALTNAPIENAKLLLYQDKKDSIPLLQKPFYFGVSDAEGKVIIENMKDGDYKAIALLDENSDYLWDRNEYMAFSESLITPFAEDSLISERVFKMSQQEAVLIFPENEEIDSLGGLKLKLNVRPQNLTFDVLESEEEMNYHYVDEEDTIHYWNINPFLRNTEFRLEIKQNDFVIDTFYLEKFDSEFNPKINWSKTPKSQVDGKKDIRLESRFYLSNLDSSLIVFTQDSVVQENPWILDDKQRNSLILEREMADGGSYKTVFLPGAIQSKDGFVNDTIVYDFTTYKSNYFGSVKLAFTNFEELNQPLIQWVDKQGNLKYQFTPEIANIELKRIKPGQYNMRIVEDRNGNGQWDPQDYFKSIQPERVFYFPESITIRSNWILEYDWQISL